MHVPYKVYIVVDRSFGERLASLPQGVPIWIVDTPVNTPVARRLWKEREGTENPHLTGITTFHGSGAIAPESILVDELDTIDLHHGSFSADPPYTQLEVFGARLCEETRTELSQYGFDEFEVTPDGFRCSRPVGTTQP
jgi:hypothetical protein